MRGQDFDNKSFSNALGKALAEDNTVWDLDLSRRCINDECVITIAEGLRKNTTVTFLDLYSNSISYTGFKALLSALHENKTLRGLDLGDNKIDGNCIKELSEFLKSNDTLHELFLEGCYEHNESRHWYELNHALDFNDTFQRLRLSRNYVDSKITYRIKINLGRNKYFKWLREKRYEERRECIFSCLEKCLPHDLIFEMMLWIGEKRREYPDEIHKYDYDVYKKLLEFRERKRVLLREESEN